MNWSTQKASDVERLLSTDIAKGLTNKIALLRVKEEGKNFLDPSLDVTLSTSMKNLFFDMAHLPILCAIIMSFSYISFLFGLLALLCWGTFIALYTFFYCRAKRRIARAAMVALAPIKVLRDGKILNIAPHLLVRGDILFLSEGDTVPCDAYILEADSLKVYEANAFEGGGQAVKQSGSCETSEKAYSEMHNILFATSEIITGTCKAVCLATGHYTLAVREKRVSSLYGGTTPDFFRKIKKKASPLLYALSFSCIAVLICGFIYGSSHFFYSFFVAAACLSSLLFACTDGISVIGYSLYLDKRRRQKRARALVKNPLSLDLLPQLDCVFVDTDLMFSSDELTVNTIHTANGYYHPQDFDKLEIDGLKSVLAYAAALETCLIADPQTNETTSQNTSPERNATHRFFSQNNAFTSSTLKPISHRTSGTDFYFDSVLLSDDEGGLIVSVGEATTILRSCSNVWNHGRVEPISEQVRAKFIDEFSFLRQQNNKILAYATARTSETKMTHSSLLHRNMTFLFFVVLRRRESGSIERFFDNCAKRRIEPIIFHTGTAESAKLLLRHHPLLQKARICDAAMLSSTNTDYVQLLDQYEIFANFSNEQKYKLFRELIDKKFRVGVLVRTADESVFLKDAHVVFLQESSPEVFQKMTNNTPKSVSHSQILTKGSDILVDADINSISDLIEATFDYRRNLLSAFSYLSGMLILRVLLCVVSAAFGISIVSMLGLMMLNFLWDTVVVYHLLIGSFTKNAQPWTFIPNFRNLLKRSINFTFPFAAIAMCLAIALPILANYVPKFNDRALALAVFWALIAIEMLHARLSFGICFSAFTKTRLIPAFVLIALLSVLPFVSTLFNVSFHWLSPIVAVAIVALFALFSAVSNAKEKKYK